MLSVVKSRHMLVVYTGVLCALLILISFVSPVWAGQLQNRSLGLSSVKAGDVAVDTVSFNFASAIDVGSLVFEYCGNSPIATLPCDAPVGLDASTATLTAQSGETGFSILSQTSNTIILNRARSTVGLQNNSYQFTGVINPSAIGPFYLRIGAYFSVDGTGSPTDVGATVGVITQGVTITSEVPQILEFCVAVSIPAQCDSATGDFLDLGNFHTNTTAAGTTQFMVGTNAAFGYVVTANGNTMTSGNDIIPALASPTASQPGHSQFGINLRANTVPAVGADPSGGSGVPTAGYDSPNFFNFVNGSIIAGHNYTSNLERYTVSYIVNIDGSEPVGVYNTTLTYVVAATF